VRCRLCGGRAVIYMPQHRLPLCRDCYPGWFLKQVGRAISTYRMFERGERILVAVSGGKDSLSLWEALVELGYEADGLHIHLGIERGGYSDASLEAARRMAERLGRRLHVVRVGERVGATIPEIARRDGRSTCSVCGIVKRYFMNKVALEGGYSCVATGHNLDDEAAVLLSNVLRWEVGYLGRQGPVLPESDGLARKVKPFCRLTEKETLMYALIRGIEFVEQECPYSAGSTTNFLKRILNQIEHESPGTKLQFYQNFLKVSGLFKGAEEPKLEPCQVCGQPTTVGVCAFCRLVRRAVEPSKGGG